MVEELLYNMSKMMVVGGNLFMIALCFMFFIIAYNKDNKKDVKKIKRTLIYDIKYNKKYSELTDTELSEERLKTLKRTVLYENTPKGNIIMYYDKDNDYFSYYSDNAIPYRYLESAAKKYVIIFDCKKIYINMHDELKLVADKIRDEKEKEKEKEKEEEEKQSMQKEEEHINSHKKETKKNIFTKFKSYNSKGGNTKQLITNSKDSEAEAEVKPIIIKEKINRYNYEGKIRNYKMIDDLTVTKSQPVEKMTFAEFKKMSQKK
jgi:hypothetical protein